MSTHGILRAIRRRSLQGRTSTMRISRRQAEAALAKTTRLPRGIAISYMGFLVGFQRRINAELRRELKPLASDLQLRQDGPVDAIKNSFQRLRTFALLITGQDGANGALEMGIEAHGESTVAFNDKKYDTELMRLVGIGDTSARVSSLTLEGWTAENVALVRNLNAEQLGKLEALFLRALRDGSRASQVQADVASILDSSVTRARLIARDQIGKLNGQLDRQKQVAAGIDSFVWRGVLDQRERPSHVAREGRVFKWRSPPGGELPGQPVQCRCSAEPNLAPLLGPEFAPEPRSESDFTLATPEARAENRRKVAAKRRRQKRRRARTVEPSRAN